MSKTHGMSKSRIYQIWECMKRRCYSKNFDHYDRYGGRGITVCDDWKNNFKQFYDWAIQNGYKENLTIDRINNDKGYYPENCRWITGKEQHRNKENTRYLTYNGITRPCSEWDEIYKFPSKTTGNRSYQGWTPEEIFSTPVKKRKKCETY